MTDQEAQQKLADAIRRRWVLRGDVRADDFAAELMPTVRTIVAEELRSFARYLGPVAEGSEQWNPYRVLEMILDRADSVEKVL